MNSLSTTAFLLAHSLSWALLYSLWQGLLIYAITATILKAMPDLSARVKYNISYGGFMALVIWFANTWVSHYTQLKNSVIYLLNVPIAAAGSNVLQANAAAASQSKLPLWDTLLHSVDGYVRLIMLVYSLGLAFMLVRFIVSIARLRTMSTQGLAPCDTQYNNFATIWQKKMGISRKVRVYISTHIDVPLMLGALKPVILLPLATVNHLSTEQVEAILLHELAHIKRHDYLLNIIQTAAETLLFFNPFVWLISGIIRREREHCCDDVVISCAASPLPYAKALAILEHTRTNDNSLALAASGRKNQLLNRIKRIMEMKKSNINYSQLTIILVAIIAVTFAIAMFTFTPSYAQKAAESKSDSTKQKTVTKTKTVTTDDNGERKVTKTTTTTINNQTADEGDDVSHLNINLSVTDDENNSGGKKIVITKSDGRSEDLSKVIEDITNITSHEVSNALASVDFKQISKEIEKATKEIDAVNWDEISAEIHNALKEVDKELNSAELRKTISKETRKGLEEARKEMIKSQAEMARARANMHAEEARARAEERRAYAEEKRANAAATHDQNNVVKSRFDDMLAKMEKDGLINRNNKYRVEKDDNQLFINGVLQSDDVFLKYKPYLKENSVTIKGSKDFITITGVDND